jgi:dienelactone hydrolase
MNAWNPQHALGQEPMKVVLKRGEFIDLAREGRVVPYKIYHPIIPPVSSLPDSFGQSMDHLHKAGDDVVGGGEDAKAKCPIILWSHGFGGNRDGASFISRFLAAHGYVIVHITHDGTDSSLWEGKEGHPWDILKAVKIPRSATLNRIRDVPFALNSLHEWARDNPDIGPHMDFENIGMSGHSFGAMTTQVMTGMLFPDENRQLQPMGDDRFKAGILYSPVPIAHLTEAAPTAVYGTINMPLLHMTGTEDDSPIEGYKYENRLVVHRFAGHPEQYLQILEGGDHMVYNGTRGKLSANPLREQHEQEILAAVYAFWEAYLKDNEAAKAWLRGNLLHGAMV